ncbi:MAG: DUF3078 domain-containing protein, partial [Bacteroidales bacterium]
KFPQNGFGSVSFSQVSLYQWTAGGEPSLSGAALLNLFANYNDGEKSWENSLDLGFGLIRQGRDEDAVTKKSNDRIEFSSQFGMKAAENWYYSGLLNFRTQFAEGYNYPDDENVISDFFAPAYMTTSVGMDYKPNENFHIFIAPIAGKFTFVLNDSLSSNGDFGVTPGDKFRAELGGLVKVAYKVDIMENVSLMTKADFFSNYLENPQNIDVNFELLLAMKINDYLSAALSVMAIYDDDVNLLQTDDTIGPGIQVKEVFGVGLSYSF